MINLKKVGIHDNFTDEPINNFWLLLLPNCLSHVKAANSVRIDLLGGLHTFFPCSWQHKLGKQSKVFLHGFGKKSNNGGGGAVH